ncbi:MAG: YciI family protein [Pseudomonadota bacterium]
MLFAVTALDKPDHLPVRMENRPAHLDFLKANLDKIKIGGPVLDPDGQSPVGSLLIIEAGDRESVEALLANDPYAKAGLFGSVEIRPWTWVIGQPD